MNRVRRAKAAVTTCATLFLLSLAVMSRPLVAATGGSTTTKSAKPAAGSVSDAQLEATLRAWSAAVGQPFPAVPQRPIGTLPAFGEHTRSCLERIWVHHERQY